MSGSCVRLCRGVFYVGAEATGVFVSVGALHVDISAAVVAVLWNCAVVSGADAELVVMIFVCEYDSCWSSGLLNTFASW